MPVKGNAARGGIFLQVIDASSGTKPGVRQVNADADGDSKDQRTESEIEKPVKKTILAAAESGDYLTIKKLVTNKDLANVRNDLHLTPLQLAINSAHDEVVVTLLEHHDESEIKDALKEAIRLDNESTAQAIIRHPRYKEVFPIEKAGKAQHKEKGLEMTPLEMAAQKDHFGVVQLLLEREQKIADPHETSCPCRKCKEDFEEDAYLSAKYRLETYKALASQAYISLREVDPIQKAFDLGKKLRDLSSIEKHYRREYLELADNLSDYVAKLLDQVNTDKELDVILNETSDPEGGKLKRLQRAIDLDEKKFVSHPSVVKKLVNVWYDNLRPFENQAIIFWLITILYIVAYPILAVLYWFAPKGKYAAMMKIPYLRFLGYCCMFLYFITAILLVVYSPTGISFGTISSEVKTHYLTLFPGQKGLRNRNDFASGRIWFFILISLFVVGMLWQEMKMLYEFGIREYLGEFYNIMDWIMLNFFITSLTLYFVQYMMSNYWGERVLTPSDDLYKGMNDPTNPDQERAKLSWYWNIPDRHRWEPYDPLIVSEGLFSFATVFAFIRITYFMRVNELFGPMQISLGRIITDIGKFIAIFVLIFFGFMVGLQNLYRYYSVDNRRKVEKDAPVTEDDAVPAMDGFGGFVKTLGTLFWSLFGMVDSNVVFITEGKDNYSKLQFTEYTGLIIFGLYNVVMVIILLNMFIAMMTQSYESVSRSSDVEWKFARARLYMDFITPGSTLSFPFNMVISFKSVFYLLTGKYCGWEKCWRAAENSVEKCWRAAENSVKDQKNGTADQIGPGGSGDRETTSIEKQQTPQGGVLADRVGITYEVVMYNLIKRFTVQRETEADIAEGEMDEIKNDIESLRYKLVNQLNDQKDQADKSNKSLEGVTKTVADIEKRMGKVEYDLTTINNRLTKINEILEKVSGGPAASGKPGNVPPVLKTLSFKTAAIGADAAIGFKGGQSSSAGDAAALPSEPATQPSTPVRPSTPQDNSGETKKEKKKKEKKKKK